MKLGKIVSLEKCWILEIFGNLEKKWKLRKILEIQKFGKNGSVEKLWKFQKFWKCWNLEIKFENLEKNGNLKKKKVKVLKIFRNLEILKNKLKFW